MEVTQQENNPNQSILNTPALGSAQYFLRHTIDVCKISLSDLSAMIEVPSKTVGKIYDGDLLRLSKNTFNKILYQYCYHLSMESKQFKQSINSRILLVDDYFLAQKKYRTLLESKGFKVDFALSAESALDCINMSNYDFKSIIVDIALPGINGLNLCKIIRSHQNPRIASLPIIILTAFADDIIYSQSNELKVKAVISKSEPDQFLLDAISSTTHNNHRRKDIHSRRTKHG